MTTGLRNERGAVLLLVLLVVALLSALLTDWAFSTLVEMRLTETFRDGNRAYYLARGGVEVGRQLLADDRNGYDGKEEFWATGVPAYPVSEDATVSISVADLDGRLNLNRIVDATGENPDPVRRDRLQRLLERLEVPDSAALVAALTDWIDRNETTTPHGAESSWYRTLQPRRDAKNEPLDTVDELLLVRGFTPQIIQKLAPLVTVRGGEKLNLNTAPREVLECWDAATEGTTIDRIVERRAEKSFRSLNAVRETIGLEDYTALNRNLDLGVASDHYTVVAVARVGDGVRTVEAEIRKDGNRLLQRKVY